VTHVVAQAGVLDLVAADRDGLGGGAVRAFLGHPAGPEDADADPRQQLPLGVPVWCVHARDDDTVPFSQSEEYVAAATAAGARAELVEVPGGHFQVIDEATEAWRRIVAVLDGIG
jgi:pimeloyl-ACP methyl ester carboxylesterase